MKRKGGGGSGGKREEVGAGGRGRKAVDRGERKSVRKRVIKVGNKRVGK
jgi:hypothetical protein